MNPSQAVLERLEIELRDHRLTRRNLIGYSAATALGIVGANAGAGLRSAAAQDEPQSGGVLLVSTSEEPFAPAFDSHVTTSLLTGRIGYLAYNGLVNVDSDRNVIPDLAESWENPDSQTYVFHLREGVTFHDGTPFDAEAVKFNIERVLDPATASSRAADFALIDEIEIVDPLTIRLHLSAPFAPMLSAFRRSNLAIISPTAIQNLPEGDDFLNASIGTGPFKFVSYTRGDRVVLERNEEYYDGPAYLDGIEVLIIPEQSTALAGMQTGSLHYMMQTNQEFGPQIESNPDLQLLTTPSTIWDFLAFNVTREPFTDKRVRQAFSMAIDREGIAQGIYKGLAVPAQGALSPAFGSFFRDNSDIPFQTYDPERAVALLEEAGFDFDQEIRFDTFTERPWGLVGDALVAQLTEIGVKLTVQKPDFNTFAAYFYDTGDYWLGNSSWTGGGVDPDSLMYKQFVTGGASNVSKSSNAELDDLLNQARIELDTETRAELYNQANRIAMEECYVAFLVHPNLTEGMRNEVQGYVFRDEYAGSFDGCWLVQ
ncbi:MAG: ABC transporter substrate-binding protein [Thermomicrobiales bacterium]|nr:ABC transporter substrate-binding protein [Thermomicrobiales bacterium]